MNPRIFLSFILSVFMIFSSCKEDDRKTGMIDEKLFYPAFTFINQELRSIDSADLALFRYETKEGNEDTSIMEKTAFLQYVEAVFTPEMLLEPSRYAFQRRIFLDETIGKVTISIDAVDPGASVKRMDMLLDPETDAIKSIYMEITSTEGPKTVFRKLTWTAGMQWSEGIEEQNGGDTILSRLRIVWGSPQ
jgi:hypothetical protein